MWPESMSTSFFSPLASGSRSMAWRLLPVMAAATDSVIPAAQEAVTNPASAPVSSAMTPLA